MKNMISVLLLILFYGCSLLKNNSTEISKTHGLAVKKSNLAVLEQKDWLSKSSTTIFFKDTSNHQYEVQIWPKGAFSFSPDKGFTGEAGQVLIRGSTQESMESAGVSRVEEKDKGRMAVNIDQQEKVVADHSDKVKETSPSWKWLLAALILTLASGWYLYRKLT